MRIYLFQRPDTSLSAYSSDVTGANIPCRSLGSAWLLRTEFTDIGDCLPLQDWGTMYRALVASGYYVFTWLPPGKHASSLACG
jgi:hypothetical protein